MSKEVKFNKNEIAFLRMELKSHLNHQLNSVGSLKNLIDYIDIDDIDSKHDIMTELECMIKSHRDSIKQLQWTLRCLKEVK